MFDRFRSIANRLCSLGAAIVVLGALLGQGASADPARISDLLGSARLFGILQQEGELYGNDLAQEMLQGGATATWQAEVSAIHAPNRLMPEYRRVFDAALEGADQGRIEAWLGSDLGRRMVTLELVAREQMLDPAVEEASIAAAQTADERDDPRLAAVRALIEAGDLIEANVVGGLNANLAFYRAMEEGGAFPYAVSESEMLADVMAEEAGIREQVRAWIEGYLYMAYAPLTLNELEHCAAFATSAPGQALLNAQFAGFDAIYERTSRELGAALARRLSSSAL